MTEANFNFVELLIKRFLGGELLALGILRDYCEENLEFAFNRKFWFDLSVGQAAIMEEVSLAIEEKTDSTDFLIYTVMNLTYNGWSELTSNYDCWHEHPVVFFVYNNKSYFSWSGDLWDGTVNIHDVTDDTVIPIAKTLQVIYAKNGVPGVWGPDFQVRFKGLDRCYLYEINGVGYYYMVGRSPFKFTEVETGFEIWDSVELFEYSPKNLSFIKSLPVPQLISFDHGHWQFIG